MYFFETHNRQVLPVQILLGTSKLYVGGCVEYIKGQHLYRTLVLSAHFLLSFCVGIGAFDRSHVFMLVQVFFFFCFVHTFYRGSCPENKCRSLRLMSAAVKKSWVVLR